MEQNMTFHHTIKGLFGLLPIEETTDITESKVLKCFEIMKKQPSAYVWINFGEYSIGYWYDRFDDVQNGIIRKATMHRWNDTEWQDMPVRKAKKEIIGILRDCVIH